MAALLTVCPSPNWAWAVSQVSTNFTAVCKSWTRSCTLSAPAIERAMSAAMVCEVPSSQTAFGSDPRIVGARLAVSKTMPGSDPNAVWLEGTSHTIAALIARSIAGADSVHDRVQDLQASVNLVDTCEAAQAQLGAGQTVNGTA